jgi:hypothetical protein
VSRSFGLVAVLAVVCAAATWGLYRETLGYGFDYDDYHFVRPYSAAEVAHTFSGSWDTQGIERPFFRPLTIAAFALRFDRLGLNARAYHALSLLLFGLAALLAGLSVERITNRWSAGLAAAAVFAVHPAMPYALVAWVTNQMHLVEIVIVLVAILWWSVVRGRRVVWWLPLLLAAAAAFLVKEDGVMLVPAILALHALRRRLLEPDLPAAPRAFVIASLGLLAALVAIRARALSGPGGYGWPSGSQAWYNFEQGLDHVFRLVPADRPWQPAASALATALPLVSLGAWRRASAGAKCGLASGAALAVLFNLPFVFVTKGEQMHLVAFGAAVVLSGSALAIADALPRGGWRAALWLALAAGLLPFAAVSRDISRDFVPFGPIVLSHDRVVREWGPVSQEIRDYLARKPDEKPRLPANPIDALQMIALGVHPFEVSTAGIRYRWMSSARSEIQVSPSVHEVILRFRHEVGAFREPARVEVWSDGRLADRLVLADSDWHVAQIAILPFTSLPLAGMHRIAITIPHAWIPSAIMPGSTDGRVLGVQIGDVETR